MFTANAATLREKENLHRWLTADAAAHCDLHNSLNSLKDYCLTHEDPHEETPQRYDCLSSSTTSSLRRLYFVCGGAASCLCAACARCCEHPEQDVPRVTSPNPHTPRNRVGVGGGGGGGYRCALSTLFLLLLASHWISVYSYLQEAHNHSTTTATTTTNTVNFGAQRVAFRPPPQSSSLSPFLAMLSSSTSATSPPNAHVRQPAGPNTSSSLIHSPLYQNPLRIGEDSLFHLQFFTPNITRSSSLYRSPRQTDITSTSSKTPVNFTRDVVDTICRQPSPCEQLRMLFAEDYILGSCGDFRVTDVLDFSTVSPSTDLSCELPLPTGFAASRGFQIIYPTIEDRLHAWNATLPLLLKLLQVNCSNILMNFVSKSEEITKNDEEFRQFMKRYSIANSSVINGDGVGGAINITLCEAAYREWICSANFVIGIVLRNGSLDYMQPCDQWCADVERMCPYLTPAENNENGGEPAFLCSAGHYTADTKIMVSTLCSTDVCCYTKSFLNLRDDSCSLDILNASCRSKLDQVQQLDLPVTDPDPNRNSTSSALRLLPWSPCRMALLGTPEVAHLSVPSRWCLLLYSEPWRTGLWLVMLLGMVPWLETWVDSLLGLM